MFVGLRSFLRRRVFGGFYRWEISRVKAAFACDRTTIGEYTERIGYLETDRLLALAWKYHVPVPEVDHGAVLGNGDPNWLVSQYLEEFEFKLILRPGARIELQSAIRAARKEHLETVRLWITAIVPSLTGLLGVIVALLAILLGRR